MDVIKQKKIKRYLAYKDSGVEWIGEIPEEWKLIKVKYLIQEIDGIKIGPFGSSLKLDTLLSDGIKVYGQSNVIKDDFDLGHRHISEERFESDFKQYEILAGDVLITMMGTTGKSKVFKSYFKRGILDSHLLRLRFNQKKFYSPLFIEILQNSFYVFHQIKLKSKGSIMEGLNSSIVKDLYICTPSSMMEQITIATYLDQKTTQTDTLIQITEQKINRLQELRTAIINQAVTKGLQHLPPEQGGTKGVPLKDSGVEWIGEVPEHWGVKSIKHSVDLKSGKSLNSIDLIENGDFPVYGGNGLRGFYNDYNYEGHYILIGRQGALCGNINYADNKFWATEHAVVATIIDGSSTVYLGELLRTMNLNQYSVSAAQPGLAVETIKNLKIPYPSNQEQINIANYLNKKNDEIDTLISKEQHRINHLKEYRQSLISEVVTGKICILDEIPVS